MANPRKHNMGAKVMKRLQVNSNPSRVPMPAARQQVASAEANESVEVGGVKHFHVGEHAGGGIFPILDASGNEVESVKGKDAAQARAAELAAKLKTKDDR